MKKQRAYFNAGIPSKYCVLHKYLLNEYVGGRISFCILRESGLGKEYENIGIHLCGGFKISLQFCGTPHFKS